MFSQELLSKTKFESHSPNPVGKNLFKVNKITLEQHSNERFLTIISLNLVLSSWVIETHELSQCEYQYIGSGCLINPIISKTCSKI